MIEKQGSFKNIPTQKLKKEYFYLNEYLERRTSIYLKTKITNNIVSVDGSLIFMNEDNRMKSNQFPW